MSSGCNNSKNTCGDVTSSACARYELDIPEISPLHGEDCVTLEETTDDIYKLLDTALTSIDLSGITPDDCLDYETNTDGGVDTKDVLTLHSTKIKELLNETGLCTTCDGCEEIAGDALNTITRANLDISKLGLDFRCLEDECGDPIVSLKQLFQAMINKIDCT